MLTKTEKQINEGILSGSMEKAMFIVAKYIKKKTGLKAFRCRGIEKFKASDSAYGIRFFTSKGLKSFRINFKNAGVSVNAAFSIDVWHGDAKLSSTRITFPQGASFVKTLPILAKVLQDVKLKRVVRVAPDDVPLSETFMDIKGNSLNEATDAHSGPDAIYDAVVELIQEPKFVKGHVWKKYKTTGFKIFTELEEQFPGFVRKVGSRYVITTGDAKEDKAAIADIKAAKGRILDAIGAFKVKVTKRSGVETYDSPVADAIMDDRERLTFEKQLKDMENLLRLVIRGASNAMFVAGRGGVGKTFTVEKILAEHGLKDGEGYFKNTGSISAAGMYNLFFKNRDGLILFDDSDDALKDQTSRNMIKAATDTKKIRKLVWNKMGANVADPDEMTYDEIEDAGLIPRHFEFTGKIIFISNLKLDKLDPDGALRTRAFIVDIDPTKDEIYEFMSSIVDNIPLEEGLQLDHKQRQLVIQLLKNGKSKQSANLRKLVRGLNMMAGAIADGITISNKEMERMIATYA